ncbi:deoxyribonuclease V [Chloroflexota bacterium]
MKLNNLHSWQLNITQAKKIQRQLADEVSGNNEVTSPDFIGGVDISVKKGQEIATGTVVVLSYPGLEIVEVKVSQGRLGFPYIPGYLSFREAPLTLATCEQLSITPDLILVDGQGIAHPRRLGLASHLGLFLNIPTIGCAKSLLCGEYTEPEITPGSYTGIIDKGEVIGAALRTKLRVKPVYVSTGHKIDLQNAVHWVMKCCRGYRLPEPTRLAHQAANGNLEYKEDFVVSGAGN